MSVPCPAYRRNPPPPLILTPALIETLASHLAAAGITGPSADLAVIAHHLMAARPVEAGVREGGADGSR